VVDDSDAAETPEDTADEAIDAEPEPWERPIDKFRRSGAGTVIAAGLLGVRAVRKERFHGNGRRVRRI